MVATKHQSTTSATARARRAKRRAFLADQQSEMAVLQEKVQSLENQLRAARAQAGKAQAQAIKSSHRLQHVTQRSAMAFKWWNKYIENLGICKVALWGSFNRNPVYLKTVMIPAGKVQDLAPNCWIRAMKKHTAPVGPPTKVDMDSKDPQWAELYQAPDAHSIKAAGYFVTVCAAY